MMPGETCSPAQLLKRLDILLADESCCSWADVLATAMALRAKAVIMPEAADLVLALDTRVISKAHMEQGRPGEQGTEHAVSFHTRGFPASLGTSKIILVHSHDN
jgi:hypothetical protein